MADPQLDLSAVTQTLRALVAASNELAYRLAREQNFNLTDSMALEVLDRRGPLGAAELARSIGIRAASATVLIDRLEHAGLVERRRDSEDRRRISVVAVPDALAENLALWAPSVMAIDRVSRSLDDAEQQVVQRYLEAVIAALVPDGAEPSGLDPGPGLSG